MVNPHLKLSLWTSTFGHCYTIYLGTKPTLVVSDANLMKEILSQSAAMGKFKNDTMLLLSRGPYGIINTEGDGWTEQRQFCLRTLVKFGFGNPCLEPSICAECQSLIEIVKDRARKNGKAGFEINSYLRFAANNTLTSLVTGERIRLRDGKLNELQQKFVESMQYTMKSGFGFFPWLRYIAPELSGYKAMNAASEEMHQFWSKYFAEHLATNNSDNPKDLIDAYLDKMKTAHTTSSFYGENG